MLRIVLRVAILFNLILFSTGFAADDKRAMTIDDSLKMKRIGEVAMSPDGRSILYSVATLDWPANDYIDEYLLYQVGGRETRPFIGEGGGEEFTFSPDNNHIAFLRNASDDNKDADGSDDELQIFIIPVDGGEAMPVTEHRGGVSAFKWMPDSNGFIFVADDTEDEDREKEIKLGDDSYFVDLAPNGKHAARYSNFWSFNIAENQEKLMSFSQLIVGDFDISPDQNRIVFVGRPDRRTNHPGDAEIYMLNVKTEEIVQLTDNRAPESSVMWSPNGRHIAYRAPHDEYFDLRSGYFWIMNTDNYEVRRLDGQSTGELSSEPHWSANSRHLIYNEVHGTNTNLYRIDIESGESQRLTTTTGTLRAHDLSTDGEHMVFSQQDFTTPPDLYVGDVRARSAERVTDLNPWVATSLQLAEGELLSWISKGDMAIEGVFYPALKNDGDRSALVLNVHGGPAGVIENAFRPDFQILAGLGYSILAPNFRGSTGYGDELLRGLMGEVGDGEYQDLMTGVDLVVADKNIDPNRMAIRGWSWGGVSTSYVITQTDRFKAASIGAMVGNWAAETGPGFNFDLSLWYIGGTPWDDPEEWRKRSSISHVKNVSTPSIIFHGGADETSSVGQSLMFYTALREIGEVPVRYMNFPREGHNFREPRHQRRLLAEEITWFKRYLDNEEWRLGRPDFGNE